MKLQVQMAAREDVYRDLARIPEGHRRGRDGKTIIEGSVCKISAGSASTFALLRGCQVTDQPVILLDERTRNQLGLACGQSTEFEIKPVGLWGQFLWAWSASDPAYRIGARMAVVSVVLGFIGLVLGVAGIFISVKSLGH
jgi:hypothetical protein